MIRAFLAALLCASPLFAGSDKPSASLDGWRAEFSEPTTRYGHDVLGGTPEWGKLCLSGDGYRGCVTLPQSSVFEDIAPRLADMDGDGSPEAVVVESDAASGAALVIYDLQDGSVTKTATPNIGTRNRWLAPFAIGDFNADGDMDVAYIDRPHLAKTLRVWSYRKGALVEIASLKGLTNHKIGEDFISGGLRDCGDGPELITADARWSSIMATKFSGDELETRRVAAFNGPSSFARMLECQ